MQGLDAATQFANNNNSYSGHVRSNDSYGNCRSVRANLMACAPCTRLLFLVMLSLHLLFVVHACEQCEIDHAESQADGAVAGCVDAWDECDDPETAQVEGCEGDPPEFLCPALLGSGLCDTTFGEALPDWHARLRDTSGAAFLEQRVWRHCPRSCGRCARDEHAQDEHAPDIRHIRVPPPPPQPHQPPGSTPKAAPPPPLKPSMKAPAPRPPSSVPTPSTEGQMAKGLGAR